MKKTKNKKVKISKPIIIAAIIGLVLGILGGALGDKYPVLSIINLIGDNWFYISIFLLLLILSFIIHIILHELGHLIFGLLTGYKFVSFRIGSITFVKEDNKFKIKRFNIPGTAGQCLMDPPEMTKDGDFPFVIYNLGGVFVNLLISIISFIVFRSIDYPYNIIPSAFFISGVFVLITNGIPLKIGGMPNDAYNIIAMKNHKDSRKAFYMQLKVNALLTYGNRPKDIGIEKFKLDENNDLSNPLNTSMKLIEYDYYLDKLDIEKAKEILNSFIPYLPKMVPIYRNEINLERIFLELVGGCDKNFIDSLYSENLEKYVELAKFMINKKRFLLAYELYYNEDRNKALEIYEELKDLAKTYPIKGEAKMEISICQWMVYEK